MPGASDREATGHAACSGARPAVARAARRRRRSYLHGVPDAAPTTGSPFLERTGGLAPDLPGFGRSGKPGYLSYTIDEYDRFIERFLDELGRSSASASSCTTGAPSAWRSPSAGPSASSGSW